MDDLKITFLKYCVDLFEPADTFQFFAWTEIVTSTHTRMHRLIDRRTYGGKQYMLHSSHSVAASFFQLARTKYQSFC